MSKRQLSKRKRQRPPLKAPVKGERKCPQTGKRGWARHGEAHSAAAALGTSNGRPVRVYLCPLCGLWHLTTKPKKGKKK